MAKNLPEKITEETEIKLNNFYRSGRLNYIVYIKEISLKDERNYEKYVGEYYTRFFRVDIYNKNMQLLAVDSILSYPGLIMGRLARYIPDLAYDHTYIGDVDTYDYPMQFKLWREMIGRCYNPLDKCFPYIGAVGTIVCDRWLCFEYFLSDLIHMDGYIKWKDGRFDPTYTIDLYEIQKHILPSRRIYGPGLVRLKQYKHSDIAMYHHAGYHSNYQCNYEFANALMNGLADVRTLYMRRTGINYFLDTSVIEYYDCDKQIDPFNYSAVKTMCFITPKEK